MAEQPFTKPVEDSVPKTGDKVAVGENLEFQRKWWKFERIIWSIFVLLIICDLLGLFGRGWLANAQRETPDGALKLNYERIERTSTPSVMTLHFGPSAIQNGHIQFYISDSIVKPLGAERISPQPATSTVGNDGITYVFPATQSPADVQISLQPSMPGSYPFRIQMAGEAPIEAHIFVVP
jgi:hypothetical protein